MRQLPVRLILASILAGIPAAAFTESAAIAPGDLTQEAMRQAAESFYSVGLDAAQVYPIAKAHLQRDRLSIDLEGGALVLSQPILGRVTGACYTGRARLSLTPPTPTERASLKSRTGSEEFRAEVESLYLRFNDGTVADLTSGLQPAADPDAVKRCSKLYDGRNTIARKYELGTTNLTFSLELDLLESLLSPALERDFFLVEAEVNEQGWVTFLLRPGFTPEMALARFKPLGSYFDPEIWLSGDRPADPGKQPGRLAASDILHNEMEIVIPDRNTFTIDARLDWKGPVELGSARFALINTLGAATWDDPQGRAVTVEKVETEDGAPLSFVHRRHELFVRLPTTLVAGATSRLRVRASEKTIIQLTPESYFVLSIYPWFPWELEYLGGRYTFDWTVKVLRPLRAAGSGTTVAEWEEKERKLNCVRWKSDRPTSHPSLIFGDFRRSTGEHRSQADGRKITVNAHWLNRVTLDFEIPFQDYDLQGPYDRPVEHAGGNTTFYIVPASKPPQIVKEAIRIIDYYEQVLGSYPHDEIDIAQMGPFMFYGQAPPGLVQITAEYFLSQALISSSPWYAGSGFMDFLKNVLPHEIAHHYWGDAVSWKKDEEQWLSESLAEYMAGMFVQVSEGEKAFKAMRNSWQMSARRWEGELPILHANRASGENGPKIRSSLLYNKGPLIIHMLRSQVGNDLFVKILKKVLLDYGGRAIDTDDFQTAAEAVAGYKLDWFFDQWIRGTGIPELKLSYAVEPAPGGKFLLKAHLTQADRANPKALFVPLVFQFGGDRRGQKEWRIKTADETLQLMLPEKPVKVLIDEPGDLLAKIVYESNG